MKYVAFLRAINVGGHAIIKMTDLKRMFESAGLENVQTYIQSGNVIFESTDDPALLAQRIERQLEKAASYRIELLVRTMREVRTIAETPAFTGKNEETLYVAFLIRKPAAKVQRALLTFKSDADDFAFKGGELYILRRDRQKSVFSNNFVEKVLQMPATTRNFTTIAKIVEKYG